jgi:hypothetical protein
MHALVVYESMWGNTEEVARAVARGMRERVEVVEVTEVGQAPAQVTGVDLLVVGGPTHAFSMSRPTTRADAVKQGASPGHEERGIREWLADLPTSDLVAVATFDTRVEKVRRLPGSAAKRAAKEVRKLHLGHVVDRESFYVHDTDGPLLDGELARAEEWGSTLADRAAVDPG